MNCSKCGKPLDNRSRFCTHCDHDNYPEMNRTQLRQPRQHHANQHTTGSTCVSKTVNSKSCAKPAQKKSSTSAIVVIIIILYILFNIILGGME